MKPPDFKALSEGSTGADGMLWLESRLDIAIWHVKENLVLF